MEKKKRPVFKIVIGLVLIVLGICVIGGVASRNKSTFSADSSGQSQSSTPTPDEQTPAVDYSVTNEALDTSNPFSASITGTLTNNTKKDLEYIQVEYVLYDSDGAQIGTAIANTNNLKAGGTWKFEAMSFRAPDGIASFELTDIAAY